MSQFDVRPQSHLAAIVEQNAAGIAETDLEGRFVLVNERYCQMVGRSREQLLQMRMQDITHPDDLAANLPLFQRAIETGAPFEIEKRYLLPDGKVSIWVSNTVSLIRDPDGRPVSVLAVSIDINKHKASEAALRESEEELRESENRFRNLADHSPMMVWVTDPEARCVFLSKSWYDFTGQSEEQALGLGWLEAVHPDDRGWSGDVFLKANAQREPFRLEYRLRSRDGTYRWAIDAASPRFGAEGEFEGYVGSVIDIHDRKQAELQRLALIELGDRFRDLEEPADIAFAAAEILGRTLDVSRAGYGTIDKARETVTIERDWNAPGIKSLAGVLHFRDYGSYIEELKRGETVVFADARTDPRTAGNWEALQGINAMSVVNMPVTEQGGFVALLYLNHDTPREWSENELGFIRDVADRTRIAVERRRAEQQFQEETMRLQTLNRTASTIAGELDLERVVQMVTDAGVELTGAQFGAFFYNVFDDAGESLMLYTLSGAERSQFEKFGMPRNTAVFEHTFSGRGVVRSDDITKDPRYGRNAPHKGMPAGHLPVCSYLAVPVRGRSGEVIGGLFFGHPQPGRFNAQHEWLMTGIAAQAAIAIDNAALYRDAQREIASRVKAEQALLLLNESLESRVSEEIERRAKSEEALHQLQKMETVGQLSGGIAHDFNNLLQVIQGNLSLLQNAVGDDRPREQRWIDNAIKGSERAAGLTQRLLAFSRRQPLAPRPLDPNQMLEGMRELLGRTLGETIELAIGLKDGAGPIEADPNQLENAILNLVVNARDAMPDGGKLTIETRNLVADAAYAAQHPGMEPGEYVLICVSDEGPGMDRETLERAIEPFFTTKEVGKGTGLGLPMVYGFVQQSGGHFSIYSELGEGTTAKIYLPRLADDSRLTEDAPVARTQAPLDERGDGELILLCEDDDDVRSFSSETLQGLGYRVIEAPDAASALELLRREGRVHLLFTDVILPGGMTGADLADQAREIQPDLRVLFTTGYARTALSRKERFHGDLEILTKPFAVSDLARRLRQLLDR